MAFYLSRASIDPTGSITNARRSPRPWFWFLIGSVPWAAAGLGVATLAAKDEPKTQAEMKRYIETIPGADVSFEMIPIPGGTFTIGSPNTEAKRAEDEGPSRRIEIAPFWMGRCEVTWDEYDIFRRNIKNRTPDSKPTPADTLADAVTRPTRPYADETFGLGRKNQPVICITHHAAMEYCRWLSAKTGKLYRLPTEAEWEYACRAGSNTTYSFGDDPSQLGDYAWYVENSEKPQIVGKKKPNAWGLFDMHGNVAEWCLDHYDAVAYSRYPADRAIFSPVLLPDAKEYPYVARGGSWDDDAELLRSASRRASEREWSLRDPQRPQSIWWHTDATFVGFRIVRPLSEQENLRGLKSRVVEKKGTK